MNEGRSRFAGRSIVGWSALGLVGMTGLLFVVYGTGEDGVRALVRATARTSLALFLSAFVASSLRRLWRSDFTAWLLRNRRYVGLSFAVSHAIHLAAIVVLARGWPESFWGKTNAVTVYGGGLGFVFVALMAATSSDAAVRWMGQRRWKRLHAVGAWYLFVIFLASYGARGFMSWGYLPASVGVFAALGLRIAARWRRGSGETTGQRSKSRLASA
jgi:DMSO/TMAO reductase YedYZ heme-binding membrane subunit